MFTAEQRTQLRAELLELAAADPSITGVAITGSAGSPQEDTWSDIDLAFGVGETNQLEAVLASWTKHMYEKRQAVGHMDIRAGAWIYRVFMLATTLQVDLAFVPAAEFRPLGPTFRLVSGSAQDPLPIDPPVAEPEAFIGWGWLYALHVRSCIARRRFWQAEYMISGLRDQTLALACLRHNLPAVHGRGIDALPAGVSAPFADALVRRVDDATELLRAFQVALQLFVRELKLRDPEDVATPRLREALLMMLAHLSPTP